MAAMLVYLDKRILNIFFWKYTNMVANFFVVLIPKDWVKTLYYTLTSITYWFYLNMLTNKVFVVYAKMCFYDVPNYYAYSTRGLVEIISTEKAERSDRREKRDIVQCLGQGKNSIEFSKELDHRNSLPTATRQGKEACRKTPRRQLSTIKREVARHPLSTSK